MTFGPCGQPCTTVMVLVDTSVWIDLLRSNDTPAVCRLKQLLDPGLAFVAPVIVQELLQGASSERNLQILRDRFIVLPRLEPLPSGSTHADAGALFARCRWAGITPRSPHDCLIAQTAIDHEAVLLHDDRDFDRMAEVEPRLHLM